MLSCIEIRVPTRHVDQDLINLRPRVFELWKPPTRPQIMVIFIDLPESIADFEMGFKIICPMLFAAVDRYATVRTLVLDMSWWL